MKRRVVIPAWRWLALADKSPVVVPTGAVHHGPDGCGARTFGGLVCTRSWRHQHRHAAAMSNGEVLAVWPNQDER